jgi:hypothetical protein
MDHITTFRRSCRLSPIFGILLSLTQLALAESPYRPGESVEYKVRGSYPEKWDQGRVIREYPGGSQYLIRQAPSLFFPEGPEMTYATSELRRPGTLVTAPTQPAAARPERAAPTVASIEKTTLPMGDGLLGKEELIVYARRLIGDQPFADSSRREKALEQIRDTIKARGTDFQYSAIDEFSNHMYAQGTMSTHIGFAINSNFGPPPTLNDYIGTFHLRAANRGSKSVKSDGTRATVTTTDSQHESGALTINRDGTYVWAYLRGSSPETSKHGRWRVASPEEMLPWEAGPAIWLLDAKQGADYMVRMNRQPGWRGWIEVGAGKGRTPVEYGQRP